jgi:hypothetical protein
LSDNPTQSRPERSFSPARLVRPIIGLLVIAFVGWRLWGVLYVEGTYGADTWARFAISGLILGGVYAVVALGYTLVYGILFMINFAHGDVMMLGAFAGYFALEILEERGLVDRLGCDCFRRRHGRWRRGGGPPGTHRLPPAAECS